ncbi:hypothetical protein Tco_0579774, partial [Tanacetum coccineum]
MSPGCSARIANVAAMSDAMFRNPSSAKESLAEDGEGHDLDVEGHELEDESHGLDDEGHRVE